VIARDIAERSRQRQMEGYLFEARQEISSRKFTAALEILKHAEELDPAAPQGSRTDRIGRCRPGTRAPPQRAGQA